MLAWRTSSLRWAQYRFRERQPTTSNLWRRYSTRSHMAGLGAPELIIILLVDLLLFGGAKLPKLARSLGQAQKEFKQGMEDTDKSDKSDKSDKDDKPEVTAGKGSETITMSKADLEALIAEREAKARAEKPPAD